MRDAYLAAQTRTHLAQQIRSIRGQRGWSQGDLGEALGKPQSAISRIEDREYGKFSLQTLFELASAFDCGLVVQLVPYAEFLSRTSDLSPEALAAPTFSRESLESLLGVPEDAVPKQQPMYLAGSDIHLDIAANNMPAMFEPFHTYMYAGTSTSVASTQGAPNRPIRGWDIARGLSIGTNPAIPVRHWWNQGDARA